MPEEPKKIVPEKKVPIIKKPEAPPKGTYSKINLYLLLFRLLSEIWHCPYSVCALLCVYLLPICYSVEQTCQINV